MEARKKVVARAKRVVIKIGSGLIAREGGISLAFFRNMAKAIGHLKSQGIEVVLVSSGAIACGMELLSISERPETISQKQAVAALGQPLLIRHYSKEFQKQKLNVAQILLTRSDIDDKVRNLNASHAVKELLRLGAVPIVNENDSVAVEEIKVGDNDQLSSLVAGLVGADLLLILTDIDGLYDRDPKKYPDAKRISVVQEVNDLTFESASGTLTQKSVGGMVTKLKAVQIAGGHGIPTWIVSGLRKQSLQSVFESKDIGTLFLPPVK